MNHHLSNLINISSQGFCGLSSIVQLSCQWVRHKIKDFPDCEGLYFRYKIKRLEKEEHSSEFSLTIKAQLFELSKISLLPRGEMDGPKQILGDTGDYLKSRHWFFEITNPHLACELQALCPQNLILVIGSLPVIRKQPKPPYEVVVVEWCYPLWASRDRSGWAPANEIRRRESLGEMGAKGREAEPSQ